MSYWRIGRILALFTALATVALAQADVRGASPQLIEQTPPEYPAAERKRRREGWVVLSYQINSDGAVVEPSVEDSSGGEAFNEAALVAIQDWRFAPAAERKSDVLMYFVYDRRHLRLSRKFFTGNAKIHKLIDNGKLDLAEKRIDAMRDDNALNAFELAYSFVTEGRIAGERGNRAEQLRCFRRAMLNQGRWLKRSRYLNLLYATVVLELQQQDFASALRDYTLLTETSPGRKIAADIEGTIQTVRALLADGRKISPPYLAANLEMTIEHEARSRSGQDDAREGYLGGSIDESEPPEQ